MRYSIDMVTYLLETQSIFSINEYAHKDCSYYRLLKAEDHDRDAFSKLLFDDIHQCNKKLYYIWKYRSEYAAFVFDFQLDHSVNIFCFGNAIHDMRLTKITNKLCKMRKSLNIFYQPLDKKNQDIVFAEYLLQQSSGNEPANELDVTEAAEKHRVLFLGYLKKYFKEFKNTGSKKTNEEIKKQIEILWKYSLLYGTRQSYILSNPTQEDLKRYQEHGRQVKCRVYSESLENEMQYFSQLPRPLLMNFLSLKNPDSFLMHLKKEAQKQLQSIKTWEISICAAPDSLKENKKNTSLKIYEVALIIQKFFFSNLIRAYQYSLVGLCAELLLWFVEFISPCGKSLPSSKKFFLKGLGALVGLWFSYLAGIYAIIKSFLVSGLGWQYHVFFTQSTINDEMATVTPRQYYFSEPVAFIQLAIITIALIETLYCFSYYPIFYGLCGILGSLLMNQLGKTLFSKIPSTLNQKDQSVFLFFFNLAGHDIGLFLAIYFLNGVEKLQARFRFSRAFCEMLQEKKINYCTTEFPESINTFSFWFYSNDKVRLNWLQGSSFYTTHCEVSPPSNELQIVKCDFPQKFNTSLLGM